MFVFFSSITIFLFLSFTVFFFNDTATTEIYTLSLHDALPISCPTASRMSTRPPAHDDAIHGPGGAHHGGGERDRPRHRRDHRGRGRHRRRRRHRQGPTRGGHGRDPARRGPGARATGRRPGPGPGP